MRKPKKRKMLIALAVLVTSLGATLGIASPASAWTNTYDGYCLVTSLPSQSNQAPHDLVAQFIAFDSCVSTGVHPVSVEYTATLQNTDNGDYSQYANINQYFGFGYAQECNGGPNYNIWEYGKGCFQATNWVDCKEHGYTSPGPYWYFGLSYRYHMSDGSTTGYKPFNQWQHLPCP